MRITDLLDKRSISLDAAPKTKSEALEKILMKDWQIQEVPKEPELNCWQLPPAPQVLPTPTWQQRDWKKQRRRKTVSLK